MKKLSLYFLVLSFLISCNTIKYVPENELLLTNNSVYIDSVKTVKEEINELLLQKPNAKSLGLPVSLYFYNLGNPKGPQEVGEWQSKYPKWYNTFKTLFSEKQSISVAKSFMGLNSWFLTNGQAPVIIQDKKTKATTKNLKNYFFTQGYFRAKSSYKQDSIDLKKGRIRYFVTKGEPSFLDSVYTSIKSPVLDSLYNIQSDKSYLKEGAQYKNYSFIKETERLIKLYRNNGIYHFNENNISFNNDTLNNYKKTKVEIAISDRLVEKEGNYVSKPFKIQKIKRINIFTDYLYKLRNNPIKDTILYNDVNYYSFDKIRYNPKYLSQSIFIKPNQVYTDSLRNLTRNHLRGLKNFKSTSIRYNELNDDELEANIFLTPIEKYTLGIDTELSRSNLRRYDIATELSLINRNTFKGAEIFKFSVSGSYFNLVTGQPGWEIGGNISLEVPRFMMPFGLSKSVPKRMFPKTTFYSGINIQKNIALDKQNISVGIDYKWNFNKYKTIQIELMNAQYIRNLNVENYFNIYTSEYNNLFDINETYGSTYTTTDLSESANEESLSTIVNVMNRIAANESFEATNPTEYQDNLNILNRYNIITSDFLIPEIAYSFTYNNQKNINDFDFSYFRLRLANSGNILGFISDKVNAKDQITFLKLPLAQYFKTDIEYKKFWKIGTNSALAHRTFLGAIITYNGSDIPFSRSYFAGGSNDIRAWQTYDLGPGTRPQGLEFNIGSLKLLSSLEYRFDFVASLKGALFVDVGNIWDITNSSLVDDESRFTGIKSLEDIAIASGFGFRYDFKFLIARLDLGFKVREPYLTSKNWFQNTNFAHSQINIGINYPF